MHLNSFLKYLEYKICPICKKHQKDFLLMGLDSPTIKNLEIIGAGKRKALCVKCNSTDRERLIYLYLRDHLKFFEKKEKLRVLHFAPEPNIARKISNMRNVEYVMGDNFEYGYKYPLNVIRIDVKNIPFEDNLSHAMNHIVEWRMGDRSEPHLVNAMARLTFETTPISTLRSIRSHNFCPTLIFSPIDTESSDFS